MSLIQFLSAFAPLHALIGTVALIAFWIAAMVRKGSPLHKTVGKVYLLAMLGIIVTAIPLALSQGLQGQWVGAAFFSYLVVLVSYSCRNAWLAIKWKRDFARFTGLGFRVSTVILAASGAAVSAVGLAYGVWLLIIFGLIGPLAALGARSLIRNGPQSPKWWLKEHYGAMIANGVATHIAFLQIGLTRLIPELGGGAIQHLSWFGPLAVAFAAGYWLDRRYLRKGSVPVRTATGPNQSTQAQLP